MNLMSADIMQKSVQKAVIAIDGAQLAADKVPLVVGIPGRFVVVMMQESDEDNPAAKSDDGHQIMHKEPRESEGLIIREERERDPGGHPGNGHATREKMPN